MKITITIETDQNATSQELTPISFISALNQVFSKNPSVLRELAYNLIQIKSQASNLYNGNLPHGYDSRRNPASLEDAEVVMASPAYQSIDLESYLSWMKSED